MKAIGRATRGLIQPGALHRASKGLFGGIEAEAEDVIYDIVYIDREQYLIVYISRDSYGTVYIDREQDITVYIDREQDGNVDITRESYEEIEL